MKQINKHKFKNTIRIYRKTKRKNNILSRKNIFSDFKSFKPLKKAA